MSDETESQVVKQKQYLLAVNDHGMVLLSTMMPGLQFICVEGLDIKDNEHYRLLANPKNIDGVKSE